MNQHITVQPLIYNGEVITQRDEMISLTDMWKAAGSPEGQRPDDWKKDASNRAFLDHVAIISNTPVKGIWKGRRGNGGGTDAHWQIGLAYGKWLDPQLHAWCNTVVRERMEGRIAPVHVVLDESMKTAIGGIVKSCTGVVIRDALEMLLPQMVQAALASGIARRNGKTSGQILTSIGFPGIRGLPVWFGNRLAKMGCLLEGRGELGESTARLFDPDRARFWLDNGGIHAVRQKAEERRGQGRLRLVGEAR